MKTAKTGQIEKILFFAAAAFAVVLALKYAKQYIYLSFTLLSLKIVWILLIFLAFLSFGKKKA